MAAMPRDVSRRHAVKQIGAAGAGAFLTGGILRGQTADLWGRDLLVSPVVEKGATARRLYLPRGAWFDFWTEERLDGAREIARAVDLDTMPLHVRAGVILPLGPIKQHVDEKVDAPLMFVI